MMASCLYVSITLSFSSLSAMHLIRTQPKALSQTREILEQDTGNLVVRFDDGTVQEINRTMVTSSSLPT